MFYVFEKGKEGQCDWNIEVRERGLQGEIIFQGL